MLKLSNGWLKKIPGAASKTAKLLPEYPFYPGDSSETEGIVYRIKLNRKTGWFEKLEGVAM